MLDSKLQGFLADCNKKTEALAQEINQLLLENNQLESLVKSHEEEVDVLKTKMSRLALQHKQIKSINLAAANDEQLIREKLTKAKNDFCDITKAYQLQRQSIKNSEAELKQKEESLSFFRKESQKIYKNTMSVLTEKIKKLENELKNRKKIVLAARLEILDINLREGYRIASIKEQNQKFNNKT